MAREGRPGSPDLSEFGLNAGLVEEIVTPKKQFSTFFQRDLTVFDANGPETRTNVGTIPGAVMLEDYSNCAGELPTDTPASISGAVPGAEESGVGRWQKRPLVRVGQGLAAAGDAVLKVSRGLKWFTSGRRGPLVLGLVALLSIMSWSGIWT